MAKKGLRVESITPVYEFEWDSEKAKGNFQKHGVAFEESATVFLDPRGVSVYDTEHSVREDRWITLGLSSTGRLLVVCHTFREMKRNRLVIRIFSSRKATRREGRNYGN